MIEISFEFKHPDGGYTTASEVTESLSNTTLNDILAKHKPDEATIHSWSVREQLPFDEGNEACLAGLDLDNNPYSEKSWKHNEWYLGWNACDESKQL
jgi:hypothetical protein